MQKKPTMKTSGRFGRKTWEWFFVAVMSVAPAVAVAQAQSHDPAEELVHRGIELRKAGHDEQALDAFRSAYETKATPRAQAQMGMAEQALGRWAEAETDLKSALKADRDPWIVKNASTLRQSLAAVSGHLGSVQIVGSPAGAHVVMDEREVGRLPLGSAVRAPAGEVLVTVSAPGYVDISRKVAVGAGTLTREVIALHAVTPASTGHAMVQTEPAGGDAVNSEEKGDPSRGPTMAGENKDESPSEPSGLTAMQSWSIALAAVGVVAAGAGLLFARQAISKNNDSRGDCAGDICNPQGAQSRWDAISAGNRATAAFVAGGVLVAGGVTLFLVGRHSSTSAGAASSAQILPVIEPGQLGLLGTARF